jgi:tRNA threonylcarbamoyladenosine modification (KEOPS) complex  Pcc1 subunit
LKLSATIVAKETDKKLWSMVCKSLEPEVEEEKKLSRGKVDLYCNNDNVVIQLETDKLSSMEAILSSYINLLKIIFDVYEANL